MGGKMTDIIQCGDPVHRRVKIHAGYLDTYIHIIPTVYTCVEFTLLHPTCI